MLMPSIFNERVFDDFMSPFTEFDRHFQGMPAHGLMKTDVKESENGYELDIELPGYKKEDVKAQLKDGYLTISASRNTETGEKDEEGKYIRRERYFGSMSRQFYVGKNVTEEDIHAKFTDGVLKLEIPKADPRKAEENKYIAIEG